MAQSAKKIIFWLVLIVVAVLIILVLSSPSSKPATSQPGQPTTSQTPSGAAQPAGTPAPTATNTPPPPPPAMQTKDLRLEVLVTKQDGTYRVRDVDAKTESDLFIPSDANITAGSREAIKEGTMITVQKFMTAANGIVALQLSIPTAK